jgi:hypothetical protein
MHASPAAHRHILRLGAAASIHAHVHRGGLDLGQAAAGRAAAHKGDVGHCGEVGRRTGRRSGGSWPATCCARSGYHP